MTQLQMYPYIDEGDLVIESSLDGVDCSPARQKLEMLFSDFLDYRRLRYESTIAPGYRQEVVEMIATLRTIAREMEVEVDGSTH
jgi:hypothetical protein